MAPLFYFAQVSLYAAIMWGIYYIVWRNRPLHTYSRIYLLAALVLPALLPFMHLPEPVSNNAAIAAYAVILPQVHAPAATGLAVHPVSYAVPWTDLLVWLYIAGCALFVALYGRAYLRIYRKLQRGKSVRQNGYTIITNTSIGPGTLGRSIFFPAHQADDVIVRHELAHIQAGHRYDALLLQLLHVIFWVSPAHWLIGQELKAVHEFEADEIASQGVDIADYAALLLSQSLNSSHSFTIAQSFFRKPLKRRIMMLQKMKAPNRSMLVFAAISLTAAFMSTVLIANPKKPAKNKVTSPTEQAIALLDMDVIKRNTPPPNGEIQALENGAIVFKTVDKMPTFDGNLQSWLVAHIHRPVGYIPDMSGKEQTLIQFTVAADGQILKPQISRTSGNKFLDDEAMRLVMLMPNWKPGIQKGIPVPVITTLSISFNGNEGC